MYLCSTVVGIRDGRWERGVAGWEIYRYFLFQEGKNMYKKHPCTKVSLTKLAKKQYKEVMKIAVIQERHKLIPLQSKQNIFKTRRRVARSCFDQLL